MWSDGTGCNDGDACTVDDDCSGGACRGSVTRQKYIAEASHWGIDPIMAVDSEDNAHIVHVDNLLSVQHVVVSTDGTVTTEDVGGRGTILNVARTVALAVDTQDGVHIVYRARENANGDTDGDVVNVLKYAYKPYNGEFTIGDVDVDPGAGSSPSITVDSDGGVHIVHVWENPIDEFPDYLRYAYKPAGGAFTEITGPSAFSGSTSIAVDSDGVVHVAYGHGSIVHGILEPGQTAFTVEAVGSGDFPSMALDSQNGVHIVFHQNDSYDDLEDLMYAYKARDDTDFSVELVESASFDNVGTYPSVAVDSNDAVHVSYQLDYDTLKYAYKPLDGSFSRHVVPGYDTYSYAGYYTSIAIDGNNGAHITHHGLHSGSYLVGYVFIPCPL